MEALFFWTRLYFLMALSSFSQTSGECRLVQILLSWFSNLGAVGRNGTAKSAVGCHSRTTAAAFTQCAQGKKSS